MWARSAIGDRALGGLRPLAPLLGLLAQLLCVACFAALLGLGRLLFERGDLLGKLGGTSDDLGVLAAPVFALGIADTALERA